MNLILFVTLLSLLGCVKGQFFEDRRCRCVCPNPASVINTTATRQIFTGNVPPNKCNCEAVVFPLLRKELEGKLHIFCPRCECKYEVRNTTLIMPQRQATWVPTVARRWYARSCRFGRRFMRNVRRFQIEMFIFVFIKAVVCFTLTTLAMAILYIISLNWLKSILGRNNRQAQRDFFQELNGRVARNPQQYEQDYVRHYRGEYERNRHFRELAQESDEEGLLNWEEGN